MNRLHVHSQIALAFIVIMVFGEGTRALNTWSVFQLGIAVYEALAK